jgi:UDP-3-O-[3-hydroxymyristoyl] N-acetylglucosamine deacetylase/3-hydroxyacyl-[acyl-carrier-protein] dehydratase
MEKQNTIRQPFKIEGKGLHTGKHISVQFYPAEINTGIVFKRTDLAGQPAILAIADYVTDTSRGTTLSNGVFVVKTIEHLLAAITGMLIDNIIIEMNCEEVPILDGSSGQYIEHFSSIGVIEQDALKNVFRINEELSIYDEEKDVHIRITPSDTFSITCVIDYKSHIIPVQEVTMHDIKDFATEFASARTFAFLHEIEYLFQNGLIKGGDLQNAIVFIDHVISEEEQARLSKYFNMPDIKVLKEGILNNVELRYKNEPARHKLIDILGDITLVGFPFTGHIHAIRPGHKTNTDFAKIIRNHILQHNSIKI